jgi:hypothetical protein
LTQNFYGVGRAVFCSNVGHKSFAYPPPAWLFAAPMDATTGPRQLFSIKQAAARPNDSIGKVPAKALKNLTLLKGVLSKLQPNRTSWFLDSSQFKSNICHTAYHSILLG